MGQIGQENDTRQYRKLKRTDYYESKAALEVKPKTSWDKCEVCGQDILGQAFSGSRDGKYQCLQCHNE